MQALHTNVRVGLETLEDVVVFNSKGKESVVPQRTPFIFFLWSEKDADDCDNLRLQEGVY